MPNVELYKLSKHWCGERLTLGWLDIERVTNTSEEEAVKANSAVLQRDMGKVHKLLHTTCPSINRCTHLFGITPILRLGRNHLYGFPG